MTTFHIEKINDIFKLPISYNKDKMELNPNIITDIENITGPNLHGFKDHRHDQSVLTNLAIKHNLNINRLLRNFITCNVNK
jgi:hypothetical protein